LVPFPSLGSNGRRNINGVPVQLIVSQRNPPTLLGAGLIDRIPDRVLEEVAAEQARAAEKALKAKGGREQEPVCSLFDPQMGQSSRPLAGRVARLKDGRIGRFGWKSQVATLREFTLQACSTELGLEVPGFARAAPPWKKDYKAPGLDLSAEQCDQLTRFVDSLPKPGQRPGETPQHTEEIAAGRKLFSDTGCTVCHRPKLGDVDGIYSDLLLHDMGQLLSNSGSYSTSTNFVSSDEDQDPLPVKAPNEPRVTKEQPPRLGVAAREWRTPPLWGLRDTAPYMHDGRADTIAVAVALHGGEGTPAAQAFFKLAPRERQQVELFLQSLAAPGPESH
jgi:hypothetical protein